MTFIKPVLKCWPFVTSQKGTGTSSFDNPNPFGMIYLFLNIWLAEEASILAARCKQRANNIVF